MAAHFDNLDDVNSKFAQTFVYFDKKAVVCKQAGYMPDSEELAIFVASLNGKGQYVSLKDKMLNYKQFNIGYANAGTTALWWFRKPQKQYRQGLQKNQLGWRTPNPHHLLGIHEGFQFSKPFAAMLENNYPTREHCKAALLDGKMSVMAFHRDFALSWDEIHEDFFLEYQGKRVGVSIGNDLTNYRLVPEAKHLQEALMEALA